MAKGSTLKNALIAFAITTLAMLSLSGPAMAQDELFEDRIERLEERIEDINDKISDLRSDIRNTDNPNVKDRKLAKIVLLQAKRSDVRSRLQEAKRQSRHHAGLIRKGWRTVFRDEFNGSELKSDNWSHEVNCSGGGNNEKQCYTDRNENSYVAKGLLHIVAKEESYSGPALVDDDPNYDPNDTSVTQPYTSARIRSKDKVDFTYGRIETRAKLTAGQGMWPAIWMLPTDYVYGGWPSSGEIDILEAVNLGVWPNEVHGTLHYGLKWPQWENHGQTLATEFNPAGDFHVYAVEWEADEIRWYIDGKHYQTQRSEGWYNYIWQGQEQGFGVANPRAPFDQNFHIIMNLAAGGDWPGNPDTGWTEDRELQVDYVRVYQCRQPRRNGNSEEGTGCASVDENVVVNEDAGAPGVNDYLVYSDGVQTLELEGRSNTPSLGFWELDEGSLIQSEIDLGAEQGLVWDVEFNGLSNVFLTAEDMSEVEGFDTGVALSGGAGWSNNGEIEFDLLVVDASVDSQFTVKLDSGYPNTGAVTIDTPEIGVWEKVSVRVSELMANPIPEGGGVNLANVLNMFVLEYAGSSAHVQIDNIRLQCAVNTEPEVWQLDQVCSIDPIVSTVAPSGDEVEVYIDSVTEWDLGVCCGGGAAIEQVDNGGGNMALQFNYDGDPGTNTVTFFQPPAPVDLSQFAGGTVEFDMFVITQPTNPAPNPWLIKVDCDTGCSSGDTPITASLEGVQPPTGSWQHYTFDLDTLVGQGLDLSKVSALVIFPAWGNQDNASYQLDNVKFVKGSTGSEPTAAAPTPTVPAGNVISVFSDAYTNIGGINYNPNWGQATVVTEESIAGNNTLKYTGLNYQGTDFAGNPQDVSAMDSFHLDFWTADSTELNVYLISPGPAETAYSLPVTPGTWVSVDIPLSEFSGVDLSNVFQLKFDGNGTVFLDNMYFSSAVPATEPTVAAPTPTLPAANVVSLFSDAYTNIGGIDYNPNWGQATVVTQEMIGGDSVLKYAGLNYQGTDFAGNPQDVSGMDSFHVDFWTADSSNLNIYLISPGPVEVAYSLPVTPGVWVSVDIPLSAFAGVDLTNVFQLKVDGNGSVFFDNLYFSSSNGGGGGGGTDGELTTNGDFETGDKSGWTEFTSGFGGGSFTVETAFDGFAGKLAAGRNESPVIKQANIGGSAVSPNMPVTISFDLSGDLQGAGGVVFAEFFSELSGEGVSKAEILGGSPLFPASSEASYCFETTTGTDVSGGITLQLKAACGDVEGCSVDAFFDNASVKLGNSCGL